MRQGKAEIQRWCETEPMYGAMLHLCVWPPANTQHHANVMSTGCHMEPLGGAILSIALFCLFHTPLSVSLFLSLGTLGACEWKPGLRNACWLTSVYVRDCRQGRSGANSSTGESEGRPTDGTERYDGSRFVRSTLAFFLKEKTKSHSY